MRTALLAAALLCPAAVVAQNSETSWDKTYPLSGKPTLHLTVGDSALNVHPCSACTAVHIHVTAENTKLSLYKLEESQSGNAVSFSLKEKPNLGFHINWHQSTSVRVDVETPPELVLEARSADGGITLRDLRGDISVSTSDGGQTLENISGSLRLQGSDGGITVRHSSGTLAAHLSDGALDVSGVFSGLDLKGSDGAMRIDLADGSHLTQPSSIHGADGSVSLRIPASFPAELDLRTSDGSIQNDLPLTVDAVNSGSDHHIHGKLDGGGASLVIQTSDGSIHLARR